MLFFSVQKLIFDTKEQEQSEKKAEDEQEENKMKGTGEK